MIYGFVFHKYNLQLPWKQLQVLSAKQGHPKLEVDRKLTNVTQ